jgi:hypothetical protein
MAISLTYQEHVPVRYITGIRNWSAGIVFPLPGYFNQIFQHD